MFFSGEHPLHVAVRLMREDVVFLCLVENDQSVSNRFLLRFLLVNLFLCVAVCSTPSVLMKSESL